MKRKSICRGLKNFLVENQVLLLDMAKLQDTLVSLREETEKYLMTYITRKENVKIL